MSERMVITTPEARAAYHDRDGAINATAIKAGAKSMLAMRLAMAGASAEPTPAMQRGTLIHLATLQPSLWDEQVAIWPGGRRTGAAFDEFTSTHAGKAILKPEDAEEIHRVAKAVLGNPLAADLIGQSIVEAEQRWSGEGYGRAKALLDMIERKTGSFIADLKTCSDLSAFNRQFFSGLRYDLQLAWYWRALDRKPAVYVVAVETSPPYDVAVWQVPQPVLQHALAKAERIARHYRECEAAGNFPGLVDARSERIPEIEPPPWYFDEAEADVGGFPGLAPDEL
jgi:hypothetical protein